MSATALSLYVLATFVGGITTGLAGFAMGLVVSGIWLHILTPVETAVLICLYGILVQIYGMWRLRRAFKWRRVAALIISGTFGVPLGAWLLGYIDPSQFRIAIGILLILYGIYGLAWPPMKPVRGHLAADIVIGFFNGVLGGMAGLSGVFITIWCAMRGWSKDEQRAVYQPVILAAFIETALWLGATGAITQHVIHLYLIGLPVLILGMLIGMKLYGHLDDVTFRKVILVLLLLSGIFLVLPASAF